MQPQSNADPASPIALVSDNRATETRLKKAAPPSLPAGSIGRQVLLLALPMLGEQIVIFLVAFVDTFLAGTISKEATAAVGTGSYMGWFISLAFSLVGVGAAAIVSRSVGARDPATANRALNQAMVMALLLGAVISAVSLVAAPTLAAMLTQTTEATRLCTLFLRIDALGYTLASITLVGGAVLRAAGDTRSPMGIMVLVNIINLFVSSALVFGWFGAQMGVAGIAIGTALARSVGGLLMLALLAGGVRGLQLRASLLRPDRAMILRMLRVGLPVAGDSGLMWTAQMGFIWVVAHTAVGEQATSNLAAHMIAMRIEAISYLPAVAWMTAAATLVGQYLGAGDPLRATRAGHTAALQGAALTSCVGAGFFFGAEAIYGLMTNDPAVAAVGAPAFRLIAFVQPFLCMAIVYIGALRGAGDTRMPMLFSLIGGIGLRVPVAYLCGIVLGGGLLGAWIGMWADNLTKFLLGWLRFLHGGWKRARV